MKMVRGPRLTNNQKGPKQMARKLTNYVFGRKSDVPDEWFDGSTWEVVKGEDFKIKVNSMRTSLSTQAALIGKKIQAEVHEDRIVFRAFEDKKKARDMTNREVVESGKTLEQLVLEERETDETQ